LSGTTGTLVGQDPTSEKPIQMSKMLTATFEEQVQHPQQDSDSKDKRPLLWWHQMKADLVALSRRRIPCWCPQGLTIACQQVRQYGVSCCRRTRIGEDELFDSAPTLTLQ